MKKACVRARIHTQTHTKMKANLCKATIPKHEAYLEVDKPSVTLLEKTDFLSPSSCQFQMACWLGLELYANFLFSMLGFGLA